MTQQGVRQTRWVLQALGAWRYGLDAGGGQGGDEGAWRGARTRAKDESWTERAGLRVFVNFFFTSQGLLSLLIIIILIILLSQLASNPPGAYGHRW